MRNREDLAEEIAAEIDTVTAMDFIGAESRTEFMYRFLIDEFGQVTREIWDTGRQVFSDLLRQQSTQMRGFDATFSRPLIPLYLSTNP